jgi:glutamyl-tRNA reductase
MSKPCSQLSSHDTDPQLVQKRLQQQAEAIKQTELEEAMRKLEQQDGLTDKQREIATAMASDIIQQIIAGPNSMLKTASRNNQEVAQTVALLFDLEDSLQHV